MRTRLLAIALYSISAVLSGQEKPAAQSVISLMQSEGEFRQIPFAEVVLAATGKKVIPLDLSKDQDRELVQKIGRAMNEVLKNMNATNSIAQQQRRINEVSMHFEDEMRR